MTTSISASNGLSQQMIIIPTAQGTYLFQTEEIIRLQADSNYTYVYTINRKPLIVSKVLKRFEALLAHSGFIRTHQSHLVNRRHIRFVDRKGIIEMSDSSRVEVSRSKRRIVLDDLTNAQHANPEQTNILRNLSEMARA